MLSRVAPRSSRRWVRLAAAGVAATAAFGLAPAAAGATTTRIPDPAACARGPIGLLSPAARLRCLQAGAAFRTSTSESTDRSPLVRISARTIERDADPCSPDPTTDPRVIVASVFKCRLAEAGFTPAEVRYSTAEALAVAACESNFVPDAVVFNGRYLHEPHPATGMRYSAAGLFQFIRSTAETWIEGGYANVLDPVANTDAAARLYIHNIQAGIPGWGDWACAAVNDGFAKRSVLPGWPGGPSALPDWVYTYVD